MFLKPNSLNKFSNIKIAVCTYHNQDDEINIKKLFDNKEFTIENTKGFLIPYNLENDTPPFIRRGLVRIKKEKNNEEN